jgi:hypothetical protein
MDVAITLGVAVQLLPHLRESGRVEDAYTERIDQLWKRRAARHGSVDA